MRPSSTCTPASDTWHRRSQAEGVDGSIRLPSPAAAATSASPKTVSCSKCVFLPLRGGGHRFRAARTESPVNIAVIERQCTLSHGIVPMTLSYYYRIWSPGEALLSSLLSYMSAAPFLLLRCFLSNALFCSALTFSVAAIPMRTSISARRRTVQIAASRQHRAIAQGAAGPQLSPNRQGQGMIGAVIAVDGRGARSELRLGVAVRAFATAATPSLPGDSDAPPASLESFLDLNDAPVRPGLSNSSVVSGDAASASEKKEHTHRFGAKQQRQQHLQREASFRGRDGQRERRRGSQGSLHQHEHGAATRRKRLRHVRTPVQQQEQEQQPGPSPKKEMRFVHSSGDRDGPTSSAVASSAAGASAHGRQGSCPERQSGAVSASTAPLRTAEEEEVSTTWSEPAGRRGGSCSKRDRWSAGDAFETTQSRWSASCVPCMPSSFNRTPDILATPLGNSKSLMQNASPSPPMPAREVYTNAGEPNCAALRRLVKSHPTCRKNYETLRRCEKVATAFERWCAEAVAHSRLVEHLASAFGSASQVGAPVRLLLTGASDRVVMADAGDEAATSTSMSAAETLAVLEVPLSVVEWLNEPIVVPELGAGTLVEAMNKVLSLSNVNKEPVSNIDGAGAGEANDSPAALYRCESHEALKIWYDAWGRLEDYRKAGAGPPNGNPAPAAPSLKASMELWHRRQCALQYVLLSHLTEGSCPSVGAALRAYKAACESVDTRDVPLVVCGPTAAGGTSCAPAQPDEHAPLRPDQVVEGAMRELLPYLAEFLQTLSAFKAAREEVKMQAEYHALGESTTAVQSKPGTVAAAAAHGAYTRLCRVARRFRASPPAQLHPQPAASGAPGKHCSDGCREDEELCTAAQQYLMSISKVDKVASHSGQSPSELKSTATDTSAHEEAGAQLPSMTLAEQAGAVPTYSAAVLDICIGVVLRCLLFYFPALSANDRRCVLQQLNAPWLTQAAEGSARVACWSAFFGVADLLSRAHAQKRQERVAALSPAAVKLRGGGSLSSSLPFFDHFTLSMLQGVVRELRFLCWPTVLDHHSSIVQHSLCLPSTVSVASPSPSSLATPASDQQQQWRSSSETLHGDSAQGTAASSTAVRAPSRSPQPRAPAWSDVIAVARASERRQRLGYELLVLFFGALQCGKALSFAAPVPATAGTDKAVAEKKALPHRRLYDKRRLNTICIYVLDVDRFITERMRTLWSEGDPWPLLRTQSSPSTGHAASPPDSRSALMELLAEQTAHPYGLSRLAFCAFSASLLQSWSTMSLHRAQILMMALQRAVAAPAALTLRSLLVTPHPDTQAGWQLSGTSSSAPSSHAIQLAARRAEWRAVAPVMALYTARASPSLWSTMWVYVSSEMESLPRRVEEMMVTAHASAVDRHGDDVAAYEEQRGESGGVHACCKELEELATMCAWLVVMAPSVCGEQPAGAGVAMPAAVQGSVLECVDRVTVEFAHCVQGVLAMWTQTGAGADAAEQLLNLFPRCPSATTAPMKSPPADAQGMEEADEAVALLVRLAETAQAHVWTSALHDAVGGWITKTRCLHAQPRALMETVQLMTPAEVSASAPSTMSAAAAAVAGLCVADDRSLAGETVASVVSDTPVLTAPPDLDSALLGWWRTMAEEDVGLPSERVYLGQVYTELLRIVSARVGLELLTPLPEKAHTAYPLDAEGDSGLAGKSTGRCAVESCGESRTSLTGNTSVGGAADQTVFSAAEVVVIVRVLSSIAARSATVSTLGLPTERMLGCGAFGKTSSASSAENAVGGETTSGNRDSILDSLRRVAVHATVAAVRAPSTATPGSTTSRDASANGLSATTDGGDSSAPIKIGGAEGTTEHDRDSAAVLSAQKAAQRIEEALLSSLTAHSGVLPAATMVEATWLRLFPLSAMQKLIDHRESPATIAADLVATPRGLSFTAPSCRTVSGKSSSAQPTVHSDLASAAATLPSPHSPCTTAVTSDSAQHLNGSLRESPSPWLRKLHDAVVTNRHSCHVSICLVSSLYSVLAAPQERGDSTHPHSAVTRCGNSSDAGSAASASCNDISEAASSRVENCGGGTDASLLATSRLRGFLTRLRTSCAEAVVLLHARMQHTDLTTASGKGNASGGGGNASQVGLASSASAGVSVAGDDDNGGAEANTSHTAAPQQEHGRRFCHVLVVASELHERLSAYTEALTCAAASCNRAEQRDGVGKWRTFRSGKAEGVRRELRLLYTSLLDSVSEFVPYGEHGNAVEVMQILGIITCRMPWQQYAQESLAPALPVEKDRQSGGPSRDETGVAAAPLEKRGDGMMEAGAAAWSSAPEDGDAVGVSVDPLLLCFREQVTRLMPYVDAEVLRCTRARSPHLLSLALISSAKSSIEYALCRVPVSSSRSMHRWEGTSATAVEAMRSGAAVVLSPIPRMAASMGVSEGASRDATGAPASGRLGLSTQPLWSQVPLESLLHRVAMDRVVAPRHALYLCLLAVNAPEFSTMLLPLTYYLRDARARISWGMLEVVFKAVAVSAANFQRHSQAEMLLRDDHPSPSSTPSPGSDQLPGGVTSSAAGRASPVSASERPRHGGSGSDAPPRGGLALPRLPTEGSSLRVGEMRYPGGSSSAASVPLFRSAAVPSTMGNAPLQLRHAWGDLARRLLHEEDDVALCGFSLWVSALYCGAMVNCAGTQVFEQLLACLVFGPTTPAASAATVTTRISTLDAVGWTLVLEACGTALDHHCRQAYQTLLRDEFIAFLERAASCVHGNGGGAPATSASSVLSSTRPIVAAAESWQVVLDDEIPFAGAWRCGLLEAIPQLFLEDAEFWCRVKGCVESWCAVMSLDPAEVASGPPSAQRRSTSALRRSWVRQLQQSFNWAVQCAGQSSLSFSDTWTTETAGADAHSVAEWMRMQLEALQTSGSPVANPTVTPPSTSPPRRRQTALLRL
ncbi:hypothetical protein MNV84_05318 [Leishmania braziliensis]|nr:hypothetical protein MNV84_05318 [Leishmania braziliensis]